MWRYFESKWLPHSATMRTSMYNRPYTAQRTWCIVYKTSQNVHCRDVRACVVVLTSVSLYYYFVVCCHFPPSHPSPPTFLVWEPLTNQQPLMKTKDVTDYSGRLFHPASTQPTVLAVIIPHTHISSLVMTIDAKNVNCSLYKRCVMCNPFHCGLQNSTDNSLPIQCQRLWAVKVSDVKKINEK